MEYVCEKCGAIYNRMLINWPQFCSLECASDAEPCACHADRGAGQTGTSTKEMVGLSNTTTKELRVDARFCFAPDQRPSTRGAVRAVAPVPSTAAMDHPESRASFGYARQKFFEALHALLGARTIDIGLTYAANYLVQLQPEDLPAEMRGEYEQLRKALTKIPLSSAASYVIRPVPEDDAGKLAIAILEMYTKLMGGL
jgi:hypothetical protein